MVEQLQPYIAIALKLVTGMIGILVFLRVAGKAQMAQITPLDTVSAFVIALAVWTAFNMFVRVCMRSARLRHLIKGESSYLVRDGYINFKAFKRNSLEMEQFRMLLRQKGIFSMFDVDDVLFETNGAVTVLPPGRTAYSHLLVNNGEIVERTLLQCNKTREWVLRYIKSNGFKSPSELFCMEWTPRKGFYFVTFSGDVRRGKEEVAAENIENESQA